MSVKDNILRVRQEISSVCIPLNRDSKEVSLLAVVKQADIIQIKEAIDSEVSDFGGNKVQDTVKKYNELSKSCCFITAMRWHMIGHLQTNKVKEAVAIFDLIHSLDSLHLAEEIDKEARKINKVQDVLMQVNVSGEISKYGIDKAKVLEFAQDILNLKNLRLKGLMTMPPFSDDAEDSRKFFKELKSMKDGINKELFAGSQQKLDILSMGMTQDYKVAIQEGATIIRLGRALFG